MHLEVGVENFHEKTEKISKSSIFLLGHTMVQNHRKSISSCIFRYFWHFAMSWHFFVHFSVFLRHAVVLLKLTEVNFHEKIEKIWVFMLGTSNAMFPNHRKSALVMFDAFFLAFFDSFEKWKSV